nr:ComEC/Rec2 family competence protein [Galbitalea soli]
MIGLATVALAGLALAGGLARARRRPAPAALLLAVVAACFAAVAAGSVVAHDPARHPPELSGVRTLSDARLVTAQTVIPGTRHFAATLVRAQGRGYAVPVLVFDGAPHERIELGSTIRLSGRLRATPRADSASFLVFASGPARVLAPPPPYLAWAGALRHGFGRAAARLPGDASGLLPGLALGDTVAVDPSLTTAMTTSSLTHLTAVSGANCAVVIGLVVLVGGALGLSRGIRIAAALVVLLAFVVLVTPQPSVLRAAVMAALVLVSLARGRPVQGVPVISVAVAVLVLADPWLAVQFGFVLSVVATVALVVIAPPLARRLGRWMPGWLALTLAVPASAQLLCQPVLILLAPTLPLYGVVANVFAEPAAPVATVIGLLACVLLPVCAPLGQLLTAVAWLPAAWIAAVARFFAGLPGASLAWPAGLPGALLLAAVTALLLLVLLARLPRTARRVLAAALAGVVIVVAVATLAGRVIADAGRPADWAIAACDVGQGDAMIVRSAGRVALLDTGPSPTLLRACLATLGVTRVDLLVLSHFDLDHIAGTPAVDGMVDRALVGPPSGRPREAQLLAGLRSAGATVEQVSIGVAGRLGDLDWRILWPTADHAGYEPGNESSVTIEFRPADGCRSGCLRSMFVGDLNEHAQTGLLTANPRLGHLDVIEVGHHGSADQAPAMYARVTAVVGLIGVGLHNRYGHPTATALGILRRVRTVVARTDLQGLVLVAPGARPGELRLWSARRGVGGGP